MWRFIRSSHEDVNKFGSFSSNYGINIKKKMKFCSTFLVSMVQSIVLFSEMSPGRMTSPQDFVLIFCRFDSQFDQVKINVKLNE